MQYLFFKTAVSSLANGHPHICQFGYVLASESFEILENGNIDINPEFDDYSNLDLLRFSLKDKEDPASYFKTKPTFDEAYEQIMDLFSLEETQLVCYEGGLDCYALQDALERYGKESINPVIFELVNLGTLFQGKVGTIKRRLRYLGFEDWNKLSFMEAEGYALAEFHFLKTLFGKFELTYRSMFGTDYDPCFPFFEDEALPSKIKIHHRYAIENASASLDFSRKKHFVFFDLECANCRGGVGKICEFGAVVCDTSFNVEERINILINPEDEFMLKGRNGQPDLELYYTEHEYCRGPIFPAVADKIRNLLERDDVLVFGHSVDNDISFLETNADRYMMKGFSFDAFDTQTMYAYLSGTEGKRTGLEAVLDELCGKAARAKFYEHRAVDDSEMTMYIAKAMVERYGKSLEDIVKECPNVMTTSIGFIDTFKHRTPRIQQFRGLVNDYDRRHNFPALDAAIRDDKQRLDNAPAVYAFTGEAKFSEHDLAPYIDRYHSEGAAITDDVRNATHVVCLDEEDYQALKQSVHGTVKASPIYLEE